MKKLFLFILMTVSAFAGSPQQKTDSLYRWVPIGTAGLNVSQVAFTNWSQGGENAITWTITSAFGLNYYSLSYALRNNLKLAYGRTKLGDLGYRTNENEFYLETIYSHSIGWAVDPYVSNTIRTNVSTGYTYTDTSSMMVSDFFDPGYVTQSVGFTYDKLKGFTSRLGVAFQETFTNKYRKYSDDSDTPDKLEAFKLETGIESVTTAKYAVAENFLYDTNLRLFTRFNNLDIWDVRWDNTLTAQVNKYINVNFNILMIYQRDQSAKTQLKQALLLGVTYTFF